ncbi:MULTISPECIES: hypothetical protein [unclassified Kitasatospora]|uniref:hypothetical protein n=1 Tax=unclassified Kitasatospora TaxID=2633591 RepID=UPI0034282A7E
MGNDYTAWKLLRKAASDWTVIDLPAIAGSPDDAVGRKVGESLWLARYGCKALVGIWHAVGERLWWLLFM